MSGSLKCGGDRLVMHRVRLAVHALSTIGVAIGVIAVYFAISLLGFRKANFELAVVALAVLPFSFWTRRSFRRWCVAFVLAAGLLVASPVDIVFTFRGTPGLRFVRPSFGPACASDACYGCTRWFNDPQWAIVVALP